MFEWQSCITSALHKAILSHGESRLNSRQTAGQIQLRADGQVHLHLHWIPQTGQSLFNSLPLLHSQTHRPGRTCFYTSRTPSCLQSNGTMKCSSRKENYEFATTHSTDLLAAPLLTRLAVFVCDSSPFSLQRAVLQVKKKLEEQGHELIPFKVPSPIDAFALYAGGVTGDGGYYIFNQMKTVRWASLMHLLQNNSIRICWLQNAR